MNILDYLRKAREYYLEHGGLRGNLSNSAGECCALGALVLTSKSLGATDRCAREMREQLRMLGSPYTISSYNDSFADRDTRRAAVLGLYDNTIATVEKQHAG